MGTSLKNMSRLERLSVKLSLVGAEQKQMFCSDNLVVVESDEKFKLFYSKLREWFMSHNMMDMSIEILTAGAELDGEEMSMPVFSFNKGGRVITKQCECIKMFLKDVCNISLIPHKSGIELFRLEVYNPGKGIGSMMMNMLNTISKEIDVKILLTLGEPGLKSKWKKQTTPAQRRNFYHKHGFKRISMKTEYWSN